MAQISGNFESSAFEAVSPECMMRMSGMVSGWFPPDGMNEMERSASLCMIGAWEHKTGRPFGPNHLCGTVVVVVPTSFPEASKRSSERPPTHR